MTLLPTDLGACFQGILPAVLATCDREGEPNVTYLSQVHYVDRQHIALSCQFFNKTQRNIAENPYAAVELYDPRTLEAYRLLLRFHHAETSGPLFDTMALRIQVIASHTGMAGVFKLRSADVYEVLSFTPVTGFLLPPDPVLDRAAPCPEIPGPLTELRGLQAVCEQVNRAVCLEGLLAETLAALDRVLGFAHSMVLVPDDAGCRLVALASHGYGSQGIGAEVRIGEGVIGTVAAERRMVRLAGVSAELRYGRAIRHQIEEHGERDRLAPEIPLAGLPDAQAHLALPLLIGDQLLGVLAVESRDALQFDEWDEAFLQIVANQIALGMDRLQGEEEEAEEPVAPLPAASRQKGRPRTVVYYRNDDCVFVDGEYLVRGVPGRILWKVLGLRQKTGQSEFSNRELRLDPGLGLPGYNANLESRLILLRKRLEAKCPDLRMVPVRRGRFALEVDGPLELIEKESA